ncbi:hypothetical protein NW767_008150 [Fusarium falciforme]|nr:hypothetical protein NW767_008150 [Fusarium falciforme]
MASPMIRFAAVPELFQAIDATPGDALVVQNVSQEAYASITKERSHQGRSFRIKRYYSELQLLIVTIPTEAHELLHSQLYVYIHSAAIQMGLGPEWVSLGTKTCRAHGHPNGDGGEGDSSGGPRNRPVGSRWPTLVIEAGYSQSLANLRADMRWWFSASNHQVKIVLLVKYDSGAGHVVIEKWQEVSSTSRQGATTTRAAASLTPTRNQVITVDRGPNSTSHTVLRGPLRLEFELLFLRAPGQGEGDVVVSANEIQDAIGPIWG